MLAIAEAYYRRHLMRRRARFSAHPARVGYTHVISVGNLTVGGTGKTPTVQWLARGLQREGHRVAVVARGYRGKLSNEGAVVSDTEQVFLDAAAAGDEPLLHARALPGIPVLIGRDRLMTARLAHDRFKVDTIILDDAFGYWSLARDFELVLLDARRPFDNGHLLPRGRLREEPAALSRANAVLLTRSDLASEAELGATREAVTRYTRAPVFLATHTPASLMDVATGERLPLDLLKGAQVGALSALADNAAFKRTLESCGATVVQHVSRGDHHAWTEREVQQAITQLGRQGARVVVTTGKDAVKIPSRTFPLQLLSLQIELRVENEAALLNQIREALKRDDVWSP
jgi:tetraacyldisaccharide 4'-kinase